MFVLQSGVELAVALDVLHYMFAVFVTFFFFKMRYFTVTSFFFK